MKPAERVTATRKASDQLSPREQRCPTCGGDREAPMLLIRLGGRSPKRAASGIGVRFVCDSAFHRGEPVGFDVPFLSPRPKGET